MGFVKRLSSPTLRVFGKHNILNYLYVFFVVEAWAYVRLDVMESKSEKGAKDQI